MSTETELPDDVVVELEAGRKISAIKKLRTHRGIGLKDAKEIVDGYIEKHPTNSTLQPPRAETGIGRIVTLVIGVGLIYAIYKYFFS
ncbi:MAG: ribosomal protein L7/L12 [Halioglobus sp.]|jgi:hypothetical protein